MAERREMNNTGRREIKAQRFSIFIQLAQEEGNGKQGKALTGEWEEGLNCKLSRSG